jgi:two-component system, chemotaxis family, chemotaxis protein CheY
MSAIKTVMIVDDSATMRRMIQASLRNLGNLRFDEAESGLAAIERLAVTSIHLMTLDLNMPDMHGLDVLRFIRAQLPYRNLPVIVLTTRGDAAAQAETLAAGASLCLSKPFAPHVLAAHVRELLEAE